MSINSNKSLSEELNKSCDSSNMENSFTEKNNTKRRISKISLQIEEMKNRASQIKEIDNDISTDDIDVDLEENENPKYSNTIIKSFRNENAFSKFDVNFTFVFDKKEFLFTLESDVFNLNLNTFKDLIKNVIHKINEKNIIFQHKKNKYILSIKDCEEEYNEKFYEDNYELRYYESKEYFKCPFDLLLSEKKDVKLYFVSKNGLNIMIRKI